MTKAKNAFEAIGLGLIDGWHQGPNLDVGMTYHDQDVQRIYDAMTYVGCGLACLFNRGWLKEGK